MTPWTNVDGWAKLLSGFMPATSGANLATAAARTAARLEADPRPGGPHLLLQHAYGVLFMLQHCSHT